VIHNYPIFVIIKGAFVMRHTYILSVAVLFTALLYARGGLAQDDNMITAGNVYVLGTTDVSRTPSYQDIKRSFELTDGYLKNFCQNRSGVGRASVGTEFALYVTTNHSVAFGYAEFDEALKGIGYRRATFGELVAALKSGLLRGRAKSFIVATGSMVRVGGVAYYPMARDDGSVRAMSTFSFPRGAQEVPGEELLVKITPSNP
jgi:hypothetical protein